MKLQAGLATLALVLAYNPSLKAQTYLLPPEFKAVDQNGVDLLSGSASLSIKLGSIGSGDGELSYTSFWGTGSILNNINNSIVYSYDEKNSKWTGIVGFNNSSKTFWQYENGPWTLLRFAGESLAPSSDGSTLVHTLRDGETRVYGAPLGATALSYSVLLTRNLPNGVIWSYDWQVDNGFARPTAVTNNLGYKISLGYQSNSTPSYGDLDNLNRWLFVTNVNFYNLSLSTSPLSTATQVNLSGMTQHVTDGGQVWKVSGNPTAPLPGVGGTFSIQTPSASSMNRTFTPVQPVNSTENTSANINGVIYNYSFSFTVGVGAGGSGITTITDPAGGVTEIKYNRYQAKYTSAAFPYQVKDALNNITSYEVINGYQVTSVTNPLGGKQLYEYDARGNITKTTKKANTGSSIADIVETASFPSSCDNMFTCNKPTSVTEVNGNTTQYSYSSDHGGLVSETLPAVNGISPVKRYRYVQRYAWIMNGSGGYMHAGGPVWLRSEERTCQATATVNDACSGGSSDEVVTTYDYGPDSGPNNLLLRGVVVTSGSQSIRTCYTYDAKGNKIAETKPLGTGGTCP